MEGAIAAKTVTCDFERLTLEGADRSVCRIIRLSTIGVIRSVTPLHRYMEVVSNVQIATPDPA